MGDAVQMYDWLVGSWDVTVTDFPEEGTKYQQQGEWHFSWVLEGRAIQDVWIVPTVDRQSEGMQNLIFSINAHNDQYGLNIGIFEAANENTNGNDFELIIRYPSEGVEFYAPVQAKKVYRNGRYLSLDHGDQIESLIKYAFAKSMGDN